MKQSGPFEIGPELFAEIGQEKFNEFMWDLITAQAHICQSKISRLHVNPCINAADKGCDAWSVKPELKDDWLGNANTCWQFKIGSAGTPGNIANEVKKEIPLKTLQRGGRYVLVATGLRNGLAGEEERKNALILALQVNSDLNIRDDQIIIYGRDNLVNWCNQLPAVALRWAGRQAGSVPMAKWKEMINSEGKTITPKKDRNKMAEKRHLLCIRQGNGEHSIYHLHICGKPGIGKSRFAFELCYGANWQPFVLYIPDHPIDYVSRELSSLANNPSVRAIVVAEFRNKIQPEDLSDLFQKIRGTKGRLRLITISECDSPNYLGIVPLTPEPLSHEEVRELITARDLDQTIINHHDAIINLVSSIDPGNPSLTALITDLAVDLIKGGKDLSGLANHATVIRLQDRLATFAEQQESSRLVSTDVNHTKHAALPDHDGHWRLLIAVYAEGGMPGGNKPPEFNSPAANRFAVHSQLVSADASIRESPQVWGGTPSPSCTFDNLHLNLLDEINSAEQYILNHPSHGHGSEMVVVLSLEYLPFYEKKKWILLLNKLRNQSICKHPILLACLDRQCANNSWKEAGNLAHRRSDRVINILRNQASQVKDIGWILVENELLLSPNPDEDPFKWRIKSADLDSKNARNILLSRDALWLRWQTSGQKFNKRIQSLLKTGVPLFWLEATKENSPPSALADEALMWQSKDFIKVYCERHGIPKPDDPLLSGYLFWEDHRYKPPEHKLPFIIPS